MVGTPAALSAAEAEGFTISHNRTKAQKSFPAIPGTYESVQGRVLPPEEIKTLEHCRSNSQDYAVAVRMTMDQKHENGHITYVRLWWPGLEDGSNDVIMYLFDGEQTEPIAQSQNQTEEPREVEIFDLPNGNFWVCVWNFDGPNQGYTIQAEVEFLERYEPVEPDPTPTPVRPTPVPTPSPVPTPRPTPVPPDPTPTPEAIATPGPDGPTSAKDLPVVVAGRQAVPGEDQGRGWRILFTTLTVLILVAGSVMVALRIRRDSA